MKSNYEEKKQARIDRYKELAEKKAALSDQLYGQAKKMADVIPFGQPILVGHHSEKRDRNYRDKIHNKFGAAFKASDTAKYYEEKVETAENNDAISSDDPNAIEKLKEKLAGLLKSQELMKAINKIVRNKKTSEAEKITQIVALGMKESTANTLLHPAQSYQGVGVPKYKLANNNGVIKNTRDRIAHLEKVSVIPYNEQEAPNSQVKLVINPQDNRVQLFFPGKPDESIIKMLKGYGFHWSPTVKAWMRQISNGAIYSAKQVFHAVENLEVGRYAQHG